MGGFIPSNRDYQAYLKAADAQTFWKVGNDNLFMVCEKPNPAAFRDLPEGYSFCRCTESRLDLWEKTAVEAPYIPYLQEYFNEVYAPRREEFFQNCILVLAPEGQPVATCLLWKSYGAFHSLGWFRTVPEQEGRGIGRALLTYLMSKAEYPVYLHTQPTSVCAIKLYSDFGFRFIKDPLIGSRKNNLQESLPILQKVMPEADFQALKTVKAPADFLRIMAENQRSEL